MKERSKTIIFILFPLIIGVIVGNLTVAKTTIDSILPAWIFPLVWTVLYILMGISSYLVYKDTGNVPKIYFYQLLINYLWVFIFFTFNNFILAFIWLLFLIILVSFMIKKFYSINKLSGYLQIPYLIWLIIASYLNLLYII